MKTDKEWMRFMLRGPIDKVLLEVKRMPLKDFVRISNQIERGWDRLIEDMDLGGDTNRE